MPFEWCSQVSGAQKTVREDKKSPPTEEGCGFSKKKSLGPKRIPGTPTDERYGGSKEIWGPLI